MTAIVTLDQTVQALTSNLGTATSTQLTALGAALTSSVGTATNMGGVVFIPSTFSLLISAEGVSGGNSVSACSFTVPYTGVISITGAITLQWDGVGTAPTWTPGSTYMLMDLAIVLGSTQLSNNSYVAPQASAILAANTSIAYLPVTAGQTVSLNVYLGDNGIPLASTTNFIQRYPTGNTPGASFANGMQWHYIK